MNFKKFLIALLISSIAISGIIFFSENKEDYVTKLPGHKLEHSRIRVNGKEQEVYFCEIDLSKGGTIKPELSYGRIFGYEKLSEMAKRKNPKVAINGGFFHEYGYPSGLVIKDGELIIGSNGSYPSIIIKNSKAMIRNIKTSAWIKLNNTENKIDLVNAMPQRGKYILYTPMFGITNRSNLQSTSIIVENGIVKDIVNTTGEVKIPTKGYMVSYFGIEEEWNKLINKISVKAEWSYDTELGKLQQAYECGCWLVKDGLNIAGDRDDWVGNLNNNDPRTAIAVLGNGQVLFIVVDGRQPGYSIGVSAKELAEILINKGAVSAAMLDGGATSEMIVEGQIINKPSYKGTERPEGGALMYYDN